MDLDRGKTRISLVLLSIPATLIFFLPLFLGAATNTFSFSEKQIGVLASSDLIGSTIASASAVFWVRLVNWRHTMLAGLLVTIIGNIVTVQLDNHTSLVALRILCGLASGTIFSLCIAYFTDTNHTQRLFGISLAAQAIVASALIFVTTEVTGGLGFDEICYTLASVGLILMPALYYVPTRGKERPRLAAGRFALAPNTIVAALAIAVFFIGTFALWAYVERIGVTHGLEPRFIGTVIGFSVGLGFTGALAAAWVEDRFGRVLPTALFVTDTSRGCDRAVARRRAVDACIGR